jgi:hypothetical protein
MPIRSILLWTLLTFIVSLGGADAAELEIVVFADRFRIGDTYPVLKGIGLARYLTAIKVYVAALYLGENVSPDLVLADVPKRLELSYFQRIAGPDFSRAAEEILPKNVPSGTIAALEPRITGASE